MRQPTTEFCTGEEHHGDISWCISGDYHTHDGSWRTLLVGLKHSAPTFSNVREFVKMGLVCFIGNGALMLPALTVGAPGCIDGPPNMAPELWVEIWNAYQAGDLQRAQSAQEQATEVTNLVRQFGLHATTKVVLSERLGIDCGDPRPPGLPLTKAQRQHVLKRAAELGLSRVMVG